jgi:flagellar FliL protein
MSEGPMSEPADSPPKPSRLPLILGLVLAPVLGGAGFYAAWSGLLPLPGASGPGTSAVLAVTPTPAAAFVPIDPITINLGTRGQARHLRFVAQLEVPPAHAAEVARQMPRIVDVLNTYLRALDLPDIEEPAALGRIRGQMLRRVRLVVGPDRVSDLLVMEFVFN